MYSLSQQDTSRDNRLNMLVESRVRREVQARFGGEFLETYRRNTARHRVLSLRLYSVARQGDAERSVAAGRDFASGCGIVGRSGADAPAGDGRGVHRQRRMLGPWRAVHQDQE